MARREASGRRAGRGCPHVVCQACPVVWVAAGLGPPGWARRVLGPPGVGPAGCWARRVLGPPGWARRAGPARHPFPSGPLVPWPSAIPGLQPSGPRLASIVCANRCATPARQTPSGNVCGNCRPGDAFRTRSPARPRGAGVAAANVCGNRYGTSVFSTHSAVKIVSGKEGALGSVRGGLSRRGTGAGDGGVARPSRA